MSWKQSLWPRLRVVIQAEQRAVFVGVLSAFFAVVLPEALIFFLGVCILVVGNFMYVVCIGDVSGKGLTAALLMTGPFPLLWEHRG